MALLPDTDPVGVIFPDISINDEEGLLVGWGPDMLPENVDRPDTIRDPVIVELPNKLLDPDTNKDPDNTVGPTRVVEPVTMREPVMVAFDNDINPFRVINSFAIYMLL